MNASLRGQAHIYSARTTAILLMTVLEQIGSGCRASNLNDSTKERVASHLLSVPPTQLSNPIEAGIGKAIIYLGNTVDAKAVTPGGSFSITHYWRVVGKIDGQWRPLIQVTGTNETGSDCSIPPSNEQADANPSWMQQAYPMSRWKPGQIIADRQIIEIRSNWRSTALVVTVGLSRGSERMTVSPVAKSGVGSENTPGRLSIAELAVTPRSSEYVVHRTRTPIEIDGSGTDLAWQQALWSPMFTTAKGGRPPVGRARARLLWDTTFLYALIEVEDTDIYSPFGNRDDTLWKADVVELFIDADRNRRGYVELQVNPNNAVFDAFFPKTRSQASHVEWNSSLRSAVSVDGSQKERRDLDHHWITEMAIPHRDVKGMAADMKIHTPPQPGDRWRLNAVRVDKPKGAKSITASSWNPITIGDFHALSRMLTIVFADAKTTAPVKAR